MSSDYASARYMAGYNCYQSDKTFCKVFLCVCLVDMNGQLQQLTDVNNQRLQELRRFNEDVYKAVMWLRGHRQMFRGVVHEPMMLTVGNPDTLLNHYLITGNN